MTHIYLRPAARLAVKSVSKAAGVAGRGLEGDHAGGGSRQLTLMERESWEKARLELGRADLDPGARRANVVVEGFSLAAAVGTEIRIGECRIRVIRENPPCRLMDDAAEGLQQALKPDMRAGVYGRIVEGGLIAVGDDVGFEDSADLG